MTEPLTITTSPREDRQMDLTIALGPERTEQALRRAAKQVAQKVNIPGFRRGKAPYATILRHFGREALLNEILDDLGQEVYGEALESEKLAPYAQAQLENVDFEPLTFKLVVPLAPDVDLGNYREVRVDETQVSVTDSDVDEVLNQHRASRATWVEIDRPAEMGDTVTIDIHGTVGEDTIMDNHDWDLQLREESGWLPGFAEAFAGLKAGEQKTFTLKYPEDSASRYKGQEANFEATVKQVKAKLEPELNDEFVKSLGEYEDVADMRAKVQDQLLRQRTSEAENKLNDAAIEGILAQAHVSYPPVAVDETLESMIDEVRRNLTRAGYGLEDYIRLQGMTVDQYREQLRPQAEKRLQGRLVLQKLTELEHIETTPQDLQAELDRLAPPGAEDEQAKALRDMLDTPAGQAVVRQDVITDKTLARLREIVTGKAPELPAGAETAAAESETGDVATTEPAQHAEAPADAEAEAGPTPQDEMLNSYGGGTTVAEAAETAGSEEVAKTEEE